MYFPPFVLLQNPQYNLNCLHGITGDCQRRKQNIFLKKKLQTQRVVVKSPWGATGCKFIFFYFKPFLKLILHKMQVCQDCESEMWKYCDLPSCPWHEKRPQHVDNHGSFILFNCCYLLHWFWFLSPYSYKNDMVSIRRPRFHILTIFIYPNPTKMIYGVNSQASSYDIPIFLLRIISCKFTAHLFL